LAAIRLKSTDKAVATYLTEAEAWKTLHAESTACLDFEELLAHANAIFDAVSSWDTLWHHKVFAEAIPYDAGDDQRIVELYTLWLQPADYLLGEIDRFERAGCAVAAAAEFRRNCAEVRGILTPDDEFFGAELIPLQEEARAAHRRGETEEFDDLGT
jgi:hypothetical protein